ncbi:MAG: S1C family serine protease, partial [Bacillota bacterium]
IVSRPGVGGFYNHEKRILIAQRMGQVMTHEFTHALHNADLDPLGQEHVPWLSEGLATLFEPAQFEGDKLVPADSFRLTMIQAAAKRNRLIPLKRLLEMDQKAFTTNAVVSLTYGQSGSLLLYLHEQGLLRKFYDAYKVRFDADKTGRLALEHVTGKNLADLENDWKTWMLRRTPPPQSTGPNGAILGVKFAEANDGLRIDYVLPKSPAQQAGLRVGDIIVGIDDQDVRDANTLVGLLASYHPGDDITLKIRRGQQYSELSLTLAPRNQHPQSFPASRRGSP